MKRTKDQVPLIIESYPDDYKGYPFVTLLRYNKETMLTIVDNCDDTNIHAFVLDLCGPEQVDEQGIVTIANHWFHNKRETYPISIEFSRLGISQFTSKIYRSFNIEHVTRVIGPVPIFDATPTRKPRRRKRKEAPKTARARVN